MTDTARERIDAFLVMQRERGVKRNEIARSLFFKGYSERQVAEVMGITPKSAHAMKIRHGKRTDEGNPVYKEAKNFLRGNAVSEFNRFYQDIKELVGPITHKYNTKK